MFFKDKFNITVLLTVNSTVVNENDEFTNPLTDDDNQQALVHQIKEFIIVIDEPLVTEDTEIVEMVLEDAQIEADTNIDSDEGNEEPH
ncbi:13072_t:CDS:2 [Entrophospora sp. SA101]|nr:13072_t:CDS:2 [Entrophospora sp. SA101]